MTSPLDPARGEHPVSRSSARLRALAALSGSLTDALGPADAASLVEQKALTALGAASAIVTTIGAFPGAVASSVDAPVRGLVHVLHAIGLPANALRALKQLPAHAPSPFAAVAHHGEPIYLNFERAIDGYPEWGAIMLGTGARAVAVVPVWANGELRGVLGLAWTAPQVFDEDECAFVVTLGVMCAQAIMRAHLRSAEIDARGVAEDANRSKTQFLTMISHELRTPMNAVMGYAQLMADGVDGPVTASQQDHLARVRSCGAHLLSLIEELLGYARVEAGGDPVHVEEVGFASLVEQALALVQPLAAAKAIGIRMDGTPAAIDVHSDPQKLRQILVNLLGNAVKFTDAGEVVLATRIDDGIEQQLVIEVTDTGPGIGADDQAHLFEAYWQIAPRSVTALGGTGLGLSYARQLARLLRGDVTIVRSEIGIGSTFALNVPVHYAPLAAAG